MRTRLDQLQHHVHQLHEYFIEIENSTTLELPLTDSDFEALHISNKNADKVPEYGDNICEEPALYLIS